MMNYLLPVDPMPVILNLMDGDYDTRYKSASYIPFEGRSPEFIKEELENLIAK